ncbi:hypothetical protein Tco_1365794, partial [Tanacetum coccineum]
DKVELDGKIVKEEEEAIKRIKREALKEKEDPGAFIFPIRLGGQVNENALADIRSDINTMPFRLYVQLGRDDMKKVGVTTLVAKFLILDIPLDRDSLIVVGHGFLRIIGAIVNTPERLFSTFYGLWEQTMTRPDHHDPNAQDMKSWKRYFFHKFTMSSCYRKDVTEMQSLEIFTSVAWIRAFNINEPIYAELCHEFYSTYEFDEVCADDELQTKKIIKFRLGGRAHSLTLLEFARRLGLYQAVELEEEGFNVYFEGGLRSDEHFNAQDYWLSISREENLGLSRSHTSTIKKPILRVIHKMITYGLCQRTTGYDKIQKNDLWLLSMFDAKHQNGYANVAWVIARWMKRKGAGTQKESQICYGQFILKIDRKYRLLTEDVDPQPGVLRVGIPRPPRASMQDLYDRMGRMEICQETIEQMEYRQSYHWDRYQEVFEHMDGVYSVPMQGAYNPPDYAQPQYDQYYQQYPPPPPQYQQQQQDNDE